MSGSYASDIITYIGVPLAVLGVLPILYNTFATLVSLSRIKRMLRRGGLTALTRSDVVNRVIEIELPRYAVTPWDRFQDRSQYWTLSRRPSSIPGGSWTTFNWRTNAIGIKTQRVEYADQVRQPQVEVAFDELVSYLLDLGAVPDPHGWKMLRSTGLWSPTGLSLMKSPDGREKALTIAPLDDSDGNLSLAVAWSSQWTTRDYSHLPPYWVRLPPPPEEKKPQEEEGGSSSDPKLKEEESAKAKDEGSSMGKKSLDSVDRTAQSNAKSPVTCQISIEGIVTALTQEEQLQSSLKLDSLYIEHIRVRPGKSNGVWFASAITAYGTTSQTILWNYKIPDEILTFSRKETVPCGVLVLLGVVDESETPEWATKHNDQAAHLDQYVRRNQEQRAAMQAEALRDRMRLDQQRREARTMEALQSPRWANKVVADHYLRWLKQGRHLAEEITLKDAVGYLLHRMVLDGDFASTICRMLDMWKAWAEMGGMRRADYNTLLEDQVSFAQATLLIAMINDTSTAIEGTLSMDLQECLRMWRKVRLG
ncbi:hypothetical protein UCRPA7_2695 [Phaeoacremonium minimum UCRPA7]|uniref:Uncharacterized protein n=1 Tax=Phaeoacremonium minimum (strain UCR-PA7) TaxID=1286976 RepID=R8BR53_PHAM7|nr:hypothetical protein UCRPA7_2695 [Phaeoacremonium minimum UCRPA7]EOO01780.1 hypothetical protein UCRPA7_2695 [Phaeoacremonium minimum UCRPA7]